MSVISWGICPLQGAGTFSITTQRKFSIIIYTRDIKSAIMLSVFNLSVAIFLIVMLNVVMLNVVAPLQAFPG